MRRSMVKVLDIERLQRKGAKDAKNRTILSLRTLRFFAACLFNLSSRRQPTDNGRPQVIQHPVPPVGVLHNLGAKERWAEDGGMRHLAAEPAADAVVVDVRDRIDFERID